jgi:hypothetical protein
MPLDKSRYVQIDEMFAGLSSTSIGSPSGPISATHGVGVSPSASTTQKPEQKRKYPKAKVGPTARKK